MRASVILTSLLLLLGLLAGCTEAVPRDGNARILTMGDSLLAWQATSGQTVSENLETLLGEEVIDRAVPGARILYRLPVTGALGLNISRQYRPGAWDWVILNGGGIDLWLGCGCVACARKLSRLISADGTRGGVPDLVRRIRAGGARVVYLGYLRSPGVGSAIEHCRDEGDAFEHRLAQMAARDEGVTFLSLADMVPYGDRTFHTVDMIHPSPKATYAIAKRIAALIR